MKIKEINLYDYFKIKNNGATGILRCYLLDNYESIGINRLHPAMVIVAGGGYEFRSPREAEPVAVSYLPYGFNAFVLEYSVAPIGFPAQLIEGAMAIAYIRENAKELNVDSEHIGLVGFSAGAHLCGMLATLYDDEIIKTYLKEKSSLCKPNAVILSYPVITSGKLSHKGSIDSLAKGDKQIEEKISIENQVNSKSVPAYIWCTATDNCVPPQNSIMLAEKYLQFKIPFELHIFEKGGHGLSLANQNTVSAGNVDYIIPHVGVWFNNSLEWLQSRGFVTKG